MARFREVLKNKNFLLLWLSQIVSQFGDRLNQMALIGFIAQRSPGKTLQLASLLAFTILPVFVVGPIAGVYVDRWDRRKTMYYCDFLRGLLVLLIPLYIIDSNKSIVPLYAVVFLLFCIGRFFVPAKLAIVPELVPKEQMLMANSLVNTTGMIASTAGFAIGGIVVTVLGAKGGFYIDSASFFVSSFLVFFIRLAGRQRVKIMEVGKEVLEAIRKSSVLGEVKEGIRYLLGRKQMRGVIAVLFLIWAALGTMYVVVIVFVQQTLKSLTLDLGLLAMFLGMGLFLGSIIYGRFGKSANCFKTIFSSLISSGLALAGFAFVLNRYPFFYTAAILAVVFGLAVGPIMTAANTLIHDVSSGAMLGKVFSSVEVVMHLAFLLFMFIGSALAEIKSIGQGGLLIGVGVLFSLIGTTGYLRQKFSVNSKGSPETEYVKA